ncbi:hypothetical protein, partial [Ferruginibacter profundus]
LVPGRTNINGQLYATSTNSFNQQEYTGGHKSISQPSQILGRCLLAYLTPTLLLRNMLTDQEFHKIFSWQPYRSDWPIDRNLFDDSINLHYGELIKCLTQHKSFDTYYSEDGGLGNYLEFFCYPGGQKIYNGNAVIVCVSLCSPIAAYGQTSFSKGIDFVGWEGLFSPDKINIISDSSLTEIETEVKAILANHKLTLIDKGFASKPLPIELAKTLMNENHNEGSQYLHGIFQKTD